MTSYRINATFEKALFDWIDAVSSLTVIWDKPNNPRPDADYICLSISSPVKNESKPALSYDTSAVYTHHFKKSFVLSVKVFSNNNSSELISDIDDSRFLQTYKLALEAQGLGIRENLGTTDITSQLEDKFQFATNTDYLIVFGKDTNENINYWEHYSAIGTFDGSISSAVTTIIDI